MLDSTNSATAVVGTGLLTSCSFQVSAARAMDRAMDRCGKDDSEGRWGCNTEGERWGLGSG